MKGKGRGACQDFADCGALVERRLASTDSRDQCDERNLQKCDTHPKGSYPLKTTLQSVTIKV